MQQVDAAASAAATTAETQSSSTLGIGEFGVKVDRFVEKVQDKYLGRLYDKDVREAKMHKKLDREFVGVAMPAFFSLA